MPKRRETILRMNVETSISGYVVEGGEEKTVTAEICATGECRVLKGSPHFY